MLEILSFLGVKLDESCREQNFTFLITTRPLIEPALQYSPQQNIFAGNRTRTSNITRGPQKSEIVVGTQSNKNLPSPHKLSDPI